MYTYNNLSRKYLEKIIKIYRRNQWLAYGGHITEMSEIQRDLAQTGKSYVKAWPLKSKPEPGAALVHFDIWSNINIRSKNFIWK
jgi:hypothetical protein